MKTYTNKNVYVLALLKWLEWEGARKNNLKWLELFQLNLFHMWQNKHLGFNASRTLDPSKTLKPLGERVKWSHVKIIENDWKTTGISAEYVVLSIANAILVEV